MPVEVAVEPQVVPIAPGARGAWTVRVRNTGEEAARCTVAVAKGDAADWSWIADPTVTVEPGGEATVRMGLHLPPPPTPAAGPLPVVVEVRTNEAGAVAVAATASVTVDVQSVVDVAGSLAAAPGKGTGQPLTVRNRGNTRVEVALAATGDPAARVTITPPSVTIGPGEVAAATVTARGKSGTPFEVELRPAGGTPQTVHGAVAGGGGRGGGGRGWRPSWKIAVPVGVVVLLVAGVLVTRGGGSSKTNAGDQIASGNTTVPDDPNCPTTNHLSADNNGIKRVGVVPPRQYSFLDIRPGGCQPVRFNPCEPVHYVTNAALAPPGGLADLAAAFQQLSEATGITFVNDGSTDEPAAINRVVYSPDRYGPRWAPILIVWAHGGPLRLQDTNPGGGRSTAVSGVYVSGVLILNVDAISDTGSRQPVPSGFGAGATWGRVMIHELGHMMGLGHVASPAEVMYNELNIQTFPAKYQAGDLIGLKDVGTQAGCVQTPPPPAR